jgi:hypothetical protein
MSYRNAANIVARSGSMVRFLDALPFDYSRPESRELRDMLAASYERDQDARKLLAEAGIPTYAINFAQAPIHFWHDILLEARQSDRLKALIEIVKKDPRRAALRDRLAELTAPRPVVEAPSGGLAPAPEDADPEQLERVLGDRSTLLDICFLKGGLRVAPAVARLIVTIGQSRFYGTGFLIASASSQTLLTNHHVLFETQGRGAKADSVEVWFSYEKTLSGEPRQAASAPRTRPPSSGRESWTGRPSASSSQ